jgi:hypothetical protein
MQSLIVGTFVSFPSINSNFTFLNLSVFLHDNDLVIFIAFSYIVKKKFISIFLNYLF